MVDKTLISAGLFLLGLLTLGICVMSSAKHATQAGFAHVITKHLDATASVEADPTSAASATDNANAAAQATDDATPNANAEDAVNAELKKPHSVTLKSLGDAYKDKDNKDTE